MQNILRSKQFRNLPKLNKNKVHPILTAQDTINKYIVSLNKEGKKSPKLSEALKNKGATIPKLTN